MDWCRFGILYTASKDTVHFSFFIFAGPFKQVFREFYIRLEEELDQKQSHAFAGYQVEPSKAASHMHRIIGTLPVYHRMVFHKLYISDSKQRQMAVIFCYNRSYVNKGQMLKAEDEWDVWKIDGCFQPETENAFGFAGDYDL